MQIDIDELMDAVESDEYIGFCRNCGAEHDGVEPDACKYPCDECGKNQVYGAETLLIMYG